MQNQFRIALILSPIMNAIKECFHACGTVSSAILRKNFFELKSNKEFLET